MLISCLARNIFLFLVCATPTSIKLEKVNHLYRGRECDNNENTHMSSLHVCHSKMAWRGIHVAEKKVCVIFNLPSPLSEASFWVWKLMNGQFIPCQMLWTTLFKLLLLLRLKCYHEGLDVKRWEVILSWNPFYNLEIYIYIVVILQTSY